ncbi:leucine-rich repeat extensin-like protein 5 [Gigantopelta aegis]|uniref:leucine-rich repeat extensin-like protein 5 n=1 Tax=Gigantopelta aegis TaxID=1735272 RepID=UPI001B88B4D0|nr:leucine-rich repeat extensin-like protein 5 [Gigantopelta aegis]
MASNSGPPHLWLHRYLDPLLVPQKLKVLIQRRHFQSKQYFGSPGSPSENPFAFIDTSLQPTASMESHPPQGNQGNQPPPPMLQGIGQPPMLVPHTYQPQPSFNSELTVCHLSFPETFPSSSETDQLLVAQDPSFDDTSHLLDSSPYHPSPTSDPSPPLLSSEPHPLSPAPYHSEPHPLNPTPYHSVSQASDPSPFIPMSIPHPAHAITQFRKFTLGGAS